MRIQVSLEKDEPVFTSVNSSQNKLSQWIILHSRLVQREQYRQTSFKTTGIGNQVSVHRIRSLLMFVILENMRCNRNCWFVGRKRKYLDWFSVYDRVQARRCLDYLDGACHVLAGNLKGSFYHVFVDTSECYCKCWRYPFTDEDQQGEFGFDMKRNGVR